MFGWTENLPSITFYDFRDKKRKEAGHDQC